MHNLPLAVNGNPHSSHGAATAGGNRCFGEGRATGPHQLRGSNDSDTEETQQEQLQQHQQLVQQRVGTQQQQQQQDEVLLSGRSHRISFENATQNFADSLAAYAVLSYLLQVIVARASFAAAAAATGAAVVAVCIKSQSLGLEPLLLGQLLRC